MINAKFKCSGCGKEWGVTSRATEFRTAKEFLTKAAHCRRCDRQAEITKMEKARGEGKMTEKQMAATAMWRNSEKNKKHLIEMNQSKEARERAASSKNIERLRAIRRKINEVVEDETRIRMSETSLSKMMGKRCFVCRRYAGRADTGECHRCRSTRLGNFCECGEPVKGLGLCERHYHRKKLEEKNGEG